MIQNYLSLVIGIFIQLVIINMVFGQVKLDNTDTNYEVTRLLTNVLELVIMLVVTVSILYYFLRNMMDTLSMTFVITLSAILILFHWLVYKTNYISKYIKRVDHEIEIEDEEPVSKQKPTQKSGEVIFSKYHNKDTNRDFSFEDSYPDYNKIKPSLKPVEKSSSEKDYSMYNGYDASHICYKCGCITGEDGNTFCGKQIPGMGTVGCSERWDCKNCKKCQGNTKKSANNNSPYTCKDCKCLTTDAGKICGRVSRADGFVKKCSSNCSKCDKCYGDRPESSGYNNNNGLIVVDPVSNLNKVVVNNIKNSDLNDVLD